MDFGGTGQDGPNFFDATVADDISTLQTLPPLDVDWSGEMCSEGNNQPAGSPFYSFPTHAIGYPQAGGDVRFGPGFGTLGASGLVAPNSGLDVQPDSLLAMAQTSTRAARNGREQQRAQKISDVIDKLKGMLDRANFTSADSSSKLHVLTRCESYLRTLKERTTCYEMEAKLRCAAAGNAPPRDSSNPCRGGGGASARSVGVDWAKSPDEVLASDESRSDETEDLDAGDVCSGRREEQGSPEGTEVSAFFDEENSVGSSGMESSGSLPGGARSASAADSVAGSSVEDFGDTGSTDSGGADTSAGATDSTGSTDSASQGFTTDTASRGFTTDSGYSNSSFGGDSGSADSSGDAGSGDTGSADGGSEESEEGPSKARMRVVNYFDIFRLSNVPMAIAEKDGSLVDVNDAMRGFGRIDEDAVKTLTVQSLVASESAKALGDAMAKMLASSGPLQGPSGAAPGGSQPFLTNASIGDRPTLLTVSLVYDERGEASAFHVALIPRSHNPQDQTSESCDRKSTEYNGEAPGVCVHKAKRGTEGRVDGEILGKRGVRFCGVGGRAKAQKREAVPGYSA